MTKETAMDMARFEALADAYGGDLRRWPAGERPAAEALLAAEPEAARARLMAADALDDLLAVSARPTPSPALRTAVLAAAPRPRRRLLQATGFWLSGAGLAVAGAAGLLIGAAASNAFVHDLQAEAVLAEVLPAPDETVDILPLSRSSAGGMV
jgi:ferric-dicitrate binding protein FerR (iron transport regulator)